MVPALVPFGSTGFHMTDRRSTFQILKTFCHDSGFGSIWFHSVPHVCQEARISDTLGLLPCNVEEIVLECAVTCNIETRCTGRAGVECRTDCWVSLCLFTTSWCGRTLTSE